MSLQWGEKYVWQSKICFVRPCALVESNIRFFSSCCQQKDEYLLWTSSQPKYENWLHPEPMTASQLKVWHFYQDECNVLNFLTCTVCAQNTQYFKRNCLNCVGGPLNLELAWNPVCMLRGRSAGGGESSLSACRMRLWGHKLNMGKILCFLVRSRGKTCLPLSCTCCGDTHAERAVSPL